MNFPNNKAHILSALYFTTLVKQGKTPPFHGGNTGSIPVRGTVI